MTVTGLRQSFSKFEVRGESSKPDYRLPLLVLVLIDSGADDAKVSDLFRLAPFSESVTGRDRNLRSCKYSVGCIKDNGLGRNVPKKLHSDTRGNFGRVYKRSMLFPRNTLAPY